MHIRGSKRKSVTLGEESRREMVTVAAGTPLLGRSNGFSKSAIARYVAFLAAFGACALIVLVLNSQKSAQALAQSGVKYYYVPKAAVRSNKLPLHLMVHRNVFIGLSMPTQVTHASAPDSAGQGQSSCGVHVGCCTFVPAGR